MANPHTLNRVMVPTEPLEIIDLEARHIEGALALSDEARWNQTKADWAMMMTAGNAIGMEAADGRLVASALSLPYGERFGWVSMVLVTADWRKMGLATGLLNSAIERLERAGLIPVLDATPAGEHVYRPLGFVPHFGFQRWQHEAAEDIELGDLDAQKFAPVTLDAITRIDADVFGGDRRHVLAGLVERSRDFSCMDIAGDGFLLGREGHLATHIGPVCSTRVEGALNMLDFALSRLKGRVFIDACDLHEDFVSRLVDYGFKQQRPFLRMAKNHSAGFGDPSQMFAVAGPELG